MSSLRFKVTKGEPASKDLQVISSGLLAHHAKQGHQRTWKKYCIFLKDKNNKTYGGIIVTFTWNDMHIDSLWVDESLRGKGYGAKLMKLAEKEAIKRNCTIAHTDTFTWQAPGFYEKLGYKSFGKIDDFPKGNSLNYYYKKLGK
ncbi:MAG: GNAT family N-acetyltransferase [Patescibacteria group bacterium]|nr:GNAT family N-acetyltransferase [Patescibacteria group bacterium]